MSPKTGTQLGSYEILEPIGAGGMGEVFRARDTKLGREVAIKVLPEAFSEDEERLARFEREARLLASLNHPNIATLHGLEQSGGVQYLVMELVKGETLAQRIRRGRVPADEALALFRQIVEALDSAHEKNVVHRDLKPANVTITPDGQVKVLDFGLAKAYAPEETNANLSDSPTLAKEDTRDGTILGTPAYMSPEQARGRRVDKRTDIWAFGCCLFEALSGTTAFGGETLSDTLSAVLRDEPDWGALPSLPPSVEPLLRHCLVKDPKRRLRDIGDALAGLERSSLAARNEPVRPPKWVGVAFGAGVLVVVVAYLFYPTGVRVEGPADVSRTVITLPPEQTLAARSSDVIALSPSGRRLVYVAESNGQRRLYLREIDRFEARPVSDTEGARAPFFSPDGESIGFFVGDEIRRTPLSGGAPILICRSLFRVVQPHAVWGPDGEIVVSADPGYGLFRVDAAGGEPKRLTTLRLDEGERGHGWPYLLPNGDVLFAITTADGFRTAVLPRATGEYRLVAGLGPTGPDARYVPSGHLVYSQSRTLFAVAFDPERLEASGAPVPVTRDVRASLTSDFAHFAMGDDGDLAYLPGAEEARLVYVDRDGGATPVLDQTGDYRYPILSPEGRRLAVTLRGSVGTDIWIHELDRGTRTRATTGGVNTFPVFTPDGERITFSRTDDMVVKRADVSGEPEILVAGSRPMAPHWSPDGQTVVFGAVDRDTGAYDIMTWRDGIVTPWAAGPFNESLPRFSPDGRWLAYMTDESGRNEIYVQAYPGPGEKWTLSTEGGTEPVWSRDGRELFYRNGERLMVVPLQLEPEFRPGVPELLFEGRYETNPGGYPNYDVTLDGSRFIMIQTETSGLNEINVVLNWHRELKRLVPVEN